VELLRRGFKAELEEVASFVLGKGEKTPWVKTVRTCRGILKLEPALWTFVYVPGVEPTNNAAEQALRPAVIWRKNSFGSDFQGGSEFVARMLTVSASLKRQQRSVLDFLVQALRAARSGAVPPALLPE
jgi:transposase